MEKAVQYAMLLSTKYDTVSTYSVAQVPPSMTMETSGLIRQFELGYVRCGGVRFEHLSQMVASSVSL